MKKQQTALPQKHHRQSHNRHRSRSARSRRAPVALKPREPRQNNYAFIDSQNLHLAIRDLGWTMDWKLFRRYLQEKHNVRKAFVLIGFVAGNESLYSSLTDAGFTLIHKPTHEVRVGNEVIIKGNVDAELVMHAMIQWQNYDKAVIVSGDGDFHCLVSHLRERGKLSRLLVPNSRRYSCLLREFSENTTYINELRRAIEVNTTKSVS